MQHIQINNIVPQIILGFEQNQEGLIDVFVPKIRGKFLSKYILPYMKNKYIKANLDRIGSATWKLIDGKRNASEISDNLEVLFGEEVKPAQERVTTFLKQLKINGFITY